jgi:hypothetical protein
MREVHLTLQGKGGVGKSVVASILAQHFYRQGMGDGVICVDGDPVNATFAGYPALKVKRLELLNANRDVDKRKFDSLMEDIVTKDATFVIDNGASSFIPLSTYMVENDVVGIIQRHGKRVVIHCVITGGQALLDTLNGLDSLASALPEGAELVVWLNEHFGEIALDGKTFEEMQVYKKHEPKIAALVRLPRQQGDTFGKDVEDLFKKRMTFAEVNGSSEFSFMAKQRLERVAKDIFSQLEAVL